MTVKLLPRGQTILEIVIATTLIVVGLIAALSLANNSQKTTNFSKNNSLATNYSYQVVDWLRNLRASLGWATFAYYLGEDSGGNSLTYCLSSSLPETEVGFAALEGSGSCNPDTHLGDTIFSRQVVLDLSDLSSGLVRGQVTTSWQENTLHHHQLDFEIGER